MYLPSSALFLPGRAQVVVPALAMNTDYFVTRQGLLFGKRKKRFVNTQKEKQYHFFKTLFFPLSIDYAKEVLCSKAAKTNPGYKTTSPERPEFSLVAAQP